MYVRMVIALDVEMVVYGVRTQDVTPIAQTVKDLEVGGCLEDL